MPTQREFTTKDAKGTKEEVAQIGISSLHHHSLRALRGNNPLDGVRLDLLWLALALLVPSVWSADEITLTPVGSWPGYPGEVASSRVAVVGNYAYLAAHDAGLIVIDMSEPANPRRVGEYVNSWWARGAAMVGNLAYVANDNAVNSGRSDARQRFRGTFRPVTSARNLASPPLQTLRPVIHLHWIGRHADRARNQEHPGSPVPFV